MLSPDRLSQQTVWEIALELAKILISGLLSRTLAPPRPVDHNLPGEAPRPIGRDRELRWLRERLSPSSPSTVCALVGPGGVGKTYLALAIAHEHKRRAESRMERWRDRFRRPPLGFFDAIVYIPGRAMIMTPRGIRPQRPLKQLSDITAEIARTLGDLDLMRQHPSERERSVLATLGRRRTLLILDGLEEMDPEVPGLHPTGSFPQPGPDHFPPLREYLALPGSGGPGSSIRAPADPSGGEGEGG